eukprot:13490954-Alexandrium_andersonii.AAC.1
MAHTHACKAQPTDGGFHALRMHGPPVSTPRRASLNRPLRPTTGDHSKPSRMTSWPHHRKH